MSCKLAFIGFRHSHILDLYRRAKETEGVEIVAACEEDPAARAEVTSGHGIPITHTSYDAMLAEVACDAVAVADYYGKRGDVVLKALNRGKHVLSDKPLCTSLVELDAIERTARARSLKVGCMLDMRDSPPFIGMRNLVQARTIGEVHGISFNGQHPLLPGRRPHWYFEPGKHGGSINDIGIHAMDAIPWITGLRFREVTAARGWNAFATDYPHFQDAGQMMLVLENGCGVLGDVSYFAPDSSGYTLPFYWRMTLWGRQGVIETSHNAQHITLALNGEKGFRTEGLPAGNPGGYLRAFLNDVQGAAGPQELDTGQVFQAARVALTVQHAADTGTPHVAVVDR